MEHGVKLVQGERKNRIVQVVDFTLLPERIIDEK